MSTQSVLLERRRRRVEEKRRCDVRGVRACGFSIPYHKKIKYNLAMTKTRHQQVRILTHRLFDYNSLHRLEGMTSESSRSSVAIPRRIVKISALPNEYNSIFFVAVSSQGTSKTTSATSSVVSVFVKTVASFRFHDGVVTDVSEENMSPFRQGDVFVRDVRARLRMFSFLTHITLTHITRNDLHSLASMLNTKLGITKTHLSFALVQVRIDGEAVVSSSLEREKLASKDERIKHLLLTRCTDKGRTTHVEVLRKTIKSEGKYKVYSTALHQASNLPTVYVTCLTFPGNDKGNSSLALCLFSHYPFLHMQERLKTSVHEAFQSQTLEK